MDGNDPYSRNRDREPILNRTLSTSAAATRWRRLRQLLFRHCTAARSVLLARWPTVLVRSTVAVTVIVLGFAAGISQQARAQTLCEVSGGSGVIQLAVGIIVSLVAIGAIVKFGAGFLQWLTGSQRAFYFSIAAGVVAIFVAANFNAIILWLFEQVSSGGGGGLSGAGVECLSGGGGG